MCRRWAEVLLALLRTGDLVRADLSLVDGSGTAPLARVSTSAHAGDEVALTDSITWALLRQVWRTRGAPTPLVSAVTTRSLPALRAYLDGARLSGEGNWDEASSAFDRAIQADSSFWLAYLSKNFVLGWSVDGSDPELDSILRAHRSELPERERLLIEAAMADSATQEMERLRAMVVRWPDYSPAQWEIADALFHFGGFFGYAPAETVFEMERAASLRPEDRYVWNHLLAALNRNRDSAAAHRLLEQYPARRLDLWSRVCANLLVAPDSMVRLADSVLATVPNPANRWGDEMRAAFLECNSPRGQVEYSRRALARPLPPAGIRAHEVFIGVAWAMRGAWDSALVAFDRLALRYSDERMAILRYRYAVAATWMGAVDARDARRRRPSGGTGSPEQLAEVWWMDGVLSYHDLDGDALARARTAIQASAASTAGDLDRSLAALAAALEGREDAAALQLAALERERAQLHRNGDEAALLTAIDRLAASRWLASRGDVNEAIELLQWPTAENARQFDWLFTNLALAGPALLEEARLQERAGRGMAARHAYARFLALWDTPHPRLAHLVAEATTAVSRLPQAAADR